MHSIHLAIPAMGIWLYKIAREIGLEIAINWFSLPISNQLIDVLKVPNKKIFIEKIAYYCSLIFF